MGVAIGSGVGVLAEVALGVTVGTSVGLAVAVAALVGSEVVSCAACDGKRCGSVKELVFRFIRSIFQLVSRSTMDLRSLSRFRHRHLLVGPDHLHLCFAY